MYTYIEGAFARYISVSRVAYLPIDRGNFTALTECQNANLMENEKGKMDSYHSDLII